MFGCSGVRVFGCSGVRVNTIGVIYPSVWAIADVPIVISSVTMALQGGFEITAGHAEAANHNIVAHVAYANGYRVNGC